MYRSRGWERPPVSGADRARGLAGCEVRPRHAAPVAGTRSQAPARRSGSRRDFPTDPVRGRSRSTTGARCGAAGPDPRSVVGSRAPPDAAGGQRRCRTVGWRPPESRSSGDADRPHRSRAPGPWPKRTAFGGPALGPGGVRLRGPAPRSRQHGTERPIACADIEYEVAPLDTGRRDDALGPAPIEPVPPPAPRVRGAHGTSP